MIDHIALKVSDHARSKRFYQEALAPLGYVLMIDHDISGSGFGRDGKPDFWIQPGESSGAIHVAFSASDRATACSWVRQRLQARSSSTQMEIMWRPFATNLRLLAGRSVRVEPESVSGHGIREDPRFLRLGLAPRRVVSILLAGAVLALLRS